MTTCADCTQDLDHCHEVLVVHADGTYDCPDSACAADPATHEWREPGPCPPARTTAPAPLAAAA